MAITNQERIGKAMELLRAGLCPFVEREFKNEHQAVFIRGAAAALRVSPRTVRRHLVATGWHCAGRTWTRV